MFCVVTFGPDDECIDVVLARLVVIAEPVPVDGELGAVVDEAVVVVCTVGASVVTADIVVSLVISPQLMDKTP